MPLQLPKNPELIVHGHLGERGPGMDGQQSDATAAFQKGHAKGGLSCYTFI